MQAAASETVTGSSTRHLGLHLSCFALVAWGEMQDISMAENSQPQSAPGPASCPGREPADAQEAIQK